jgi:hypothetical protein
VGKVHEDWDQDELLFGYGPTGRQGEDLYRLDFILGEDNCFQAQLFLLTELGQEEWKRRCEKGGEPTRYVSARLFIERDNRIPRDEGGDGERWDYAFRGWKLKPDEAAEVLRRGEKAAVRLMKKYVDEVAAMPNDRKWLTDEYGPPEPHPYGNLLESWEKGHGKLGWEKILKKWAAVDAAPMPEA